MTSWWLDQGLTNSIIGIELDEQVAGKTRGRLQRYPNVKIITGSAIEKIPSNGTVFYLYNPFDATVMELFKRALVESSEKIAAARIIYYNCEHVAVFQDDPAWNVRCFDPVLSEGGDRFAIITARSASAAGNP